MVNWLKGVKKQSVLYKNIFIKMPVLLSDFGERLAGCVHAKLLGVYMRNCWVCT